MYGTSTDKFCKGTNIPKHSGNFSKFRMHYCTQSYRVELRNGELIVGTHTPATSLFSHALIELMITDPNFRMYEQKGVHTFNGKKYNCWKRINKSLLSECSLRPDFTYYECIDTEGDFEYTFPEY